MLNWSGNSSPAILRAFDAIVRRFQDRVFRLASVWLYDEQSAADVAQEVFVRGYKGLAVIPVSLSAVHLAVPYDQKRLQRIQPGAQDGAAWTRNRRTSRRCARTGHRCLPMRVRVRVRQSCADFTGATTGSGRIESV